MLGRPTSVGLAALLAAAGVLLARTPCEAIPDFAHRYGVTCQACHTIVPRLNAFGEKFEAAGYRWPATVRTDAAFPVTMKSNLAYSSAASTLPKYIVDEVEFLVMGSAGNHWTYRVEQYAVDGGVPGSTRDAYVQYFGDAASAWHDGGRAAFDVKAGQFTLPLPNDPETQRPTENHYALYDQTVGANPFNFFDDRIGVDAHLSVRGAELSLLAMKGHDPQSGLPTQGTDTMASVRAGTDALSLYAYRYDGTRPLGPVADAFERTGIGIKSITGKSRATLVLQTGRDSSSDGFGLGAASSGGYVQEEWAFSDRFIGVARYDGTSAPGSFLRSTTGALIFRIASRARLTVEDVVTHSPSTANTINAALLFAY